MSNIHFEYPELFGLLLLFLICSYFCKEKRNALLFPRVHFFGNSTLQNRNYLVYIRWWVIITLITTLASPYYVITQSQKPKEGLNIAMVVDASQSMSLGRFDSSNLRKNRFAVVQEIVGDFIEKRKNDNIGLVVFGEYAYIASPLTFDKKILREILNTLHIGIAGNSTAIYDAIGQTVALLKNDENSSNIAILLTDGANTAGILPRDKAIELAKNHNIKIYTIGIGRQGEINPIDLADIAEQTGGKFFIARNKQELEQVYNTIDKLEKKELKDITYNIKEYLYFYPLLISMLSLIIYITLKNREGLF